MSESADTDAWYRVENEAEIPTPALLLHHARIVGNIDAMLEIAGGAARLRPHVKTHKLAPLVAAQVRKGITKFKCATIAEAAMTAEAGGEDVLLAFPPIGPAANQLAALQRQFPEKCFSAIVDSAEAIEMLSAAAARAGVSIGVFLDLDCGMHRTGILPDDAALELYRAVCAAPALRPLGLHAYDGHIQAPSVEERVAQCEAAFEDVLALQQRLRALGLPAETLIAGGSPTFAIHAQHPERELSPGTSVLWDFGYGDKFLDLPFRPAAVLLTRVVSKPGEDRLCLDLGHKAVAAEAPHPRVRFLELPEAVAALQSEEHLVVETPHASEFPIGACLHGIPRHVCPTVALHDRAWLVENGTATTSWPITARDRHWPA